MDRLSEFTSRIDSDPRIASLSLVAGRRARGRLAASAPRPRDRSSALATDLSDLVGPLDADDPEAVDAWLRRASERGLWHDWWVTTARDVARAAEPRRPADVDVAEADDPSSSHHAALRHYAPEPGRLTVTVDVDLAGPVRDRRAGADDRGTRSTGPAGRTSPPSGWSGLTQLPSYAAPPRPATRRSSWSGRTSRAADVRRRLVPEPDRRAQQHRRGPPARRPRRHHLPRPHRLRHPALPRLTRGLARLPRAAAPDRPQRRRHHHHQRRRRRAACSRRCRGSSPSACCRCRSAWTTSRAEQAPEPRATTSLDLVKALGGKSIRRRAGQRLPAQEPRLRDQGVGGGPAGGPAVRPRPRRPARQEQQLEGAGGRPHRAPPRPARAHPRRRARVVAEPGLAARQRRPPSSIPTSAEGFGFVPYEAAALGTPTVFTDFGPLRGDLAACRACRRAGRSSSTRLISSRCWPSEEARDDRVARPAGRHRAPHVGRFRGAAGRLLRARHPDAGGGHECRGRRHGRGGRGGAVVDPVEPHVAGDRAAAEGGQAAQGPSGLSMGTGAAGRSLLDRALFGSPRWAFLAGHVRHRAAEDRHLVLSQHLGHRRRSSRIPSGIRSRRTTSATTRCGRG